MTATPTFRGWRALVLHRMDEGVERLVRQLERLGLSASVQWNPPGPAPAADIVLVDADQGWDELLAWDGDRAPVPLVALLASEAPGRIAWALAKGAGALIAKPVVAASVYPALVMAAHIHAERAASLGRARDLEERMRLRPLVHQAVRTIMSAQALDEAGAYARLRHAAMSRRMLLEQVAAGIVAGHDALPEAG